MEIDVIKKEIKVGRLSDEEVEKMRPEIDKAVKRKMELIAANHPPDYWENVMKMLGPSE